MNQNGYLFTAGVTLSQVRPVPGMRAGKTLQTWDTCMSAMVYSGDAEHAQKAFEDWCRASREAEDPIQTEIRKIVGARIIEQLLTESGGQNLDWSLLSRRLSESASSTDTGEANPADLGEGYWVDVNQAVPADSAASDMESLERGLAEDISSALNWSPEKRFLFLVSSLSAPPVVTELYEEVDEEDPAQEQSQSDAGTTLDEAVAHLPEMREKEAAALVEARNSVVAAWLWRKFSANTPLASNDILVSPCCGIIPGT
jgi:hypothetical protein